MQCHRRRVGQLEPMLGIQLENAMLGRWVAAISFEHRIYGRKPLAVLGGHSEWVYDVTWSPDGGTLASGAGAQDGTVRYWQPA